MKKLYSLILFFFLQCVFSQSGKMVVGIVSCENIPVQGIQITNLVSEKSTISDGDGKFQIFVNLEDMLVFTSINYDYKRKFINQEDLKISIIEIEITKKPEQLEEAIVINNSKINAVNLGILSKPAKEYTPAERRLKTAGDFKPIQLLGIFGGQLPLDPIINAITGRTAMLKKELQVERNQKLLAKVSELYEEEFYTKKLKINKEFIQAFQYFIIEDQEFAQVMKTKNKSLIKLSIINLAEIFNKKNQNEKQ